MGHSAVIRRSYESLSSASPEALAALAERLDPDYELHEFQTGPDPTVYRGREGFLEWARQGLEVFDEPRFEPLDFSEDGDTVLVTVHVHFLGRASGAPVEMLVYHVWDFRDGRPLRLRGFLDEDEARDAARLTPRP